MGAERDVVLLAGRPSDELPRLCDIGSFEKRLVDLDVQRSILCERSDGLLASRRRARQYSADGSTSEQLDQSIGLLTAVSVEVAFDVVRVGVIAGAGRAVSNEVNGHGGERYSPHEVWSKTCSPTVRVMTQMLLRDLCGVRSGDKGDISDLSLFADSVEAYEVIRSEVTAERVAEHFGALVEGTVTRYEVANVWALKFVMTDALGGGGPASLRADNLGKTLGGALLRLSIEVPAAVAAVAPRNGRRPPVPPAH